MKLLENSSLIVLGLAALLDYLIGDPWGWLHPVQVIGGAIAFYSHQSLKFCQQAIVLRLAGISLTLGVISTTLISAWFILSSAYHLNFLLGMGLDTILLASCFAGRSLNRATQDVLQPLNHDQIELAREKLSRYVGRDTQNLTPPEILRALLETVAENTVDGVTAPLFFALVGAVISPILMTPLALAYKAASTLDSMVGYQTPPYTDLGWCSAKLEDYLTWLPCRLTVLTLIWLSGTPRRVWQICQRDANQDPSPNSGWSESAYAAILGVQLGGINHYQGIPKLKPYLGDPIHPITSESIVQATHLMRNCFLIWLIVGLIGFALGTLA